MLEIFDVFKTGAPLEISAQILGFVALIISVISYQMRTYNQIMIVQIICAAFFVIHMGMLYYIGHTDAISGCVGNGMCLIRDVVFWIAAKKKEKRPWIKTVVFCVLMVVTGLITWQSPISLLCIVGLIFNTLSFSMKEPQKVRKIILISSPFFLVYDFLSASIGGVGNELISFTSAVVGLIRYRKKPAE